MGTSSEIRGLRLSVRLPRRTVPIWVRLPIGLLSPVRIASTPATKVVATAPMPGSSTPSFPVAGAISRGLYIRGHASPLERGDANTRRAGGA